MKTSMKLHEAFAQKRTAFGAWQMLPGANISRILAQSGVDWVMVDGEHGNMADSAMHEAVPAISAAGVSPLVRVPDIQGWMIKRALDCGAHGILVPLLRNADEAREVVRYAKFPPTGCRGFGSPISPDRFNQGLGLSGYLQQANDALITMVQIETKEALENVDEIAAVSGIDVLYLGPFDLGNSIGFPIIDGVVKPELKSALMKVLNAGHKAGKRVGMFVSGGEQAKEYAELGFDMISMATDYSTLDHAFKQHFSLANGNGNLSQGGSY